MVAKKAVPQLPEVFRSNERTSAVISRAARAGACRKIAPRLYTPNMVDSPTEIIRRSLWQVLGLLFRGTVVGYRSVLEMKPTPRGTVFLVGSYARTASLPGLTVRILKGKGPLEGDMPFGDSLHIASEARALLECLSLKRMRGTESPTLPRAKIEAFLERKISTKGEAWANDLRDRARTLAPLLGMEEACEVLDGLVGTLLGTRRARVTAPMALARIAGQPYDADRLERFGRLVEALRGHASVDRPDPELSGDTFRHLAFFDAYFSNFIEGTEFGVEEAAEIVFEHKIPQSRPADAHDVLGTYQVVGSGHEMRTGMARFANDPEAALGILKARHATIMHGRPETKPGEFKEEANRAGDTLFVNPPLVIGTLRQGLQLLPLLTEPFHRAVYMMFLVSEVHPFNDGNGRIARAMMNAELISEEQRRILVPTSFRTDYLGALRSHSRRDDPMVLIQALDCAQHFTAAVDFREFQAAQAELQAWGAFDTGEAARLRQPAR